MSQAATTGARIKPIGKYPFAHAATIAAHAGTKNAGNEARRLATVSAGRGHAVKRTRFVFPISEPAPVVLADAKYPQMLNPVSANNAYGTPPVSTCPTALKPT